MTIVNRNLGIQARVLRVVAMILLLVFSFNVLASCDTPDSDDFREAFFSLGVK